MGGNLQPHYNNARSHSSLLPWNELSEEEKEKDRDIVCGIPKILACAKRCCPSGFISGS